VLAVDSLRSVLASDCPRSVSSVDGSPSVLSSVSWVSVSLVVERVLVD
jgi:hypothetical protein